MLPRLLLHSLPPLLGLDANLVSFQLLQRRLILLRQRERVSEMLQRMSKYLKGLKAEINCIFVKCS